MRNIENKKGVTWPLLAIICLAILPRIWLFAIVKDSPERSRVRDSKSYIYPAAKLYSTGNYPADNGERTPIYPIMIAAVAWIASPSTNALIGGQIILDLATIILTFQLGKQLFTKPIALLTALLMAINIESITFDFLLLTETLATFLIMATLLAWTNAYQQASAKWAAFAGVLLGISALCRPIALPLVPIMAASLLFQSSWQRPQTPQRLRNTILFLLSVGISLAPWMLRNYYVLGKPVISTIASKSLLYYEAASLEADTTGQTETQLRGDYTERVAQKLQELNLVDTPMNTAHVEAMLARQIIFQNPGRFILIHLKADLVSFLPGIPNLTELLGLTQGDRNTLDVLRKEGLQRATLFYFGNQKGLLLAGLPWVILLGCIYCFDLLGAWVLIKQKNWLAVILLVLIPAYFLITPGAAAVPRFRIPVMPYLCLLSAFGYTIAIERIKAYTKKQSLQ